MKIKTRELLSADRPSYSHLFEGGRKMLLRHKPARGKTLKRRGLRVTIVMLLALFVGVLLSVLKTPIEGPYSSWPDEAVLVELSTCHYGEPKVIRNGGETTWEMSYDARFAPGEELLVIGELYQLGKPMRPLARKVFAGSTGRKELTVTFARTYEDVAKTTIAHSAKLQLGRQVVEIPRFTVDTERYLNDGRLVFFPGGELRKPEAKEDIAHLTRLVEYSAISPDAEDSHIWFPGFGPGASSSSNQRYCVMVSMIPLSRLKYLVVEPEAGLQGLDGQTISSERGQLKEIAARYKQHLAMSLPLTGFGYWKDKAVDDLTDIWTRTASRNGLNQQSTQRVSKLVRQVLEAEINHSHFISQPIIFTQTDRLREF